MTYTQQVAKQILEKIDGLLLVGYSDLISQFLIGYFSQGHLLIEGPPGTGKTLAAKLFAHVSGKSFKRIQFTSDMLPSDIIGSHIYSPAAQNFNFIRGPLFTDFVLADEINRTPPRTQSAMLEAMEERQVTIDGQNLSLSENFFVIATQNPRDFEGTFPLPEAQLDRFLMQIKLRPLDIEKEQFVLKLFISGALPADFARVAPVDINFQKVLDEINHVKFDESLIGYVTKIVHETRNHPQLYWGGSARASIALLKTSRVCALLQGRDYVIPDDIKSLSVPVLQHRIKLNAEAQVSGLAAEVVINDILKKVAFPA